MQFDALQIGMYDNGNSSTAITLNMNQSLQKVTLTGNCTFTFTDARAGSSGILVLTQDATGSRTVTWPSTVTAVRTPHVNPSISTSTVYYWMFDGTNYHFAYYRLPMGIGNVTEAAPTQAQCITEFGTAAAVGAGFIGLIKDNNADSAMDLVVSNGTSYYHVALVKGA